MYKQLLNLRLSLEELEQKILEQISSISSFEEDEYYIVQKIVTVFHDMTIVTTRELGSGENGEEVWSIDGHEFWGNEQEVMIEIFEQYNRIKDEI